MDRWKLVSSGGKESQDPRLLVANIAAVFFGQDTGFKFAGSTSQSQAIESALIASQNFHSSLGNGATLETVSQALKEKNKAGLDFYATTGVRWPL